VDLNTITQVRRPDSADAITKWENGFAWLAGGTWLFSEPQITTHTLIDLEALTTRRSQKVAAIPLALLSSTADSSSAGEDSAWPPQQAPPSERRRECDLF
jgi:hypothetical protein